MSSVFISGIPAAGKTYLARKIAKKFNLKYVSIDDFRETLDSNPYYEPILNFYWNQDEAKYWDNTSCPEHWQNLVKQSEGLWKPISDYIKSISPPSIFEGVNLLPHLMSRDFDTPGIYLLGESEKQIFERNKKEPRWGKTLELQKIEAKMFFNCERKWYKNESKKYKYKNFSSSQKAENELARIAKRIFKKR